MEDRIEKLEDALVRQDMFLLEVFADNDFPEHLRVKYIEMYNKLGIRIETENVEK